MFGSRPSRHRARVSAAPPRVGPKPAAEQPAAGKKAPPPRLGREASPGGPRGAPDRARPRASHRRGPGGAGSFAGGPERSGPDSGDPGFAERTGLRGQTGRGRPRLHLGRVRRSPPGPSAARPFRSLLGPRPSAGAVRSLPQGCAGPGHRLRDRRTVSPSYVSGASLASDATDLVPHLIYLAAWAAAAVLIFRGGARARTGALLGLGTGVVTFGLFLADAGTPIAPGGSRACSRAGLVLGIIGWFFCTAGSAVALGAAARPDSPAGAVRPGRSP